LTPGGVKAGCDVVRLAPDSSYHLVLPQNQPPSLNYVLNHWPYLQINNVQDFIFDGHGSTLYFTGPTHGIDINNSQRVAIQNLTLDYGDPVDPNPLWRGPWPTRRTLASVAQAWAALPTRAALDPSLSVDNDDQRRLQLRRNVSADASLD
jgi:hypothetical protein